MKRKLMTSALIIAMLAVLVAGASLAYFTDTDSAANTFTVGNVDITLYESTLHRENAGYANGTTAAQVKPNNAELWSDVTMEGTVSEKYTAGNSAAYSDQQIIDNAATYQDTLSQNNKLAPGMSYHKMPYVKNTGSNPAYIRIRVMIPSALDTSILNSCMYTTTAMKSGEFAAMQYDNSGNVERDGVKYNVYSFVRNEALQPDEMTYWNVWGTVHMDADVTNEEITALKASGDITENGSFNVLVEADAIQTEGFDSAAKAFAEFDK